MADKGSKFDQDAAAVQSVYEAAQLSAKMEIQRQKEENAALKLREGARLNHARAIGRLDKIALDRAHNDFLEIVTLYQVKESKSYKEGGFTWDEFCEAAGIDRRQADRKLEDIEPIVAMFPDKLSAFLTIPFNKIKYLGKALSGQMSITDGGPLIIDGVEIPFEKDEIEAAIDRLKEVQKQTAEDHASTLRAKDRLLESKDKVIEKQEREITRLEKSAPPEPVYSSEEEKYIDIVADLGLQFERYLIDIKTRLPYDKEKIPEAALNKLIYLLMYIHRETMELRLDVSQFYEPAGEGVAYEPMEMELPSMQEMQENVPHVKAVLDFMKKKAASHASKEVQTSPKE
jgi:hypothetical protein